MLGILDTGGGFRDVYGCGVFDWLLDKGRTIPYAIGVSAGTANIASYQAGQKGRNLRFYLQYSQRKEYFGPYAYLTSGSLFNLDYIYSTLADEGGEDPIDMKTLKADPSQFIMVATDIKDAKPAYFTKDDLDQNETTVIKASCAIPFACKPVAYRGGLYADGGVSDPIPYQKAFRDGVSHLIAILTRPTDEVRQPEKHRWLYSRALRKYPALIRALDLHHSRYNQQRAELLELEKQGLVTILAPKDLYGLKNTTRDPERLKQLYEDGYADAERLLKDHPGFA